MGVVVVVVVVLGGRGVAGDKNRTFVLIVPHGKTS